MLTGIEKSAICIVLTYCQFKVNKLWRAWLEVYKYYKKGRSATYMHSQGFSKPCFWAVFR